MWASVAPTSTSTDRRERHRPSSMRARRLVRRFMAQECHGHATSPTRFGGSSEREGEEGNQRQPRPRARAGDETLATSTGSVFRCPSRRKGTSATRLATKTTPSHVAIRAIIGSSVGVFARPLSTHSVLECALRAVDSVDDGVVNPIDRGATDAAPPGCRTVSSGTRTRWTPGQIDRLIGHRDIDLFSKSPTIVPVRARPTDQASAAVSATGPGERAWAAR